jgi:hypothetical protein
LQLVISPKFVVARPFVIVLSEFIQQFALRAEPCVVKNVAAEHLLGQNDSQKKLLEP